MYQIAEVHCDQGPIIDGEVDVHRDQATRASGEPGLSSGLSTIAEALSSNDWLMPISISPSNAFLAVKVVIERRARDAGRLRRSRRP